MHRTSLGVLKVLTAGTILALGCLAIVHSAEIVAFFGSYALWIIAALAAVTALNVIVGMTLGWLLGKPELRRPRATSARRAGVLAIPAPTSPHDSEHDLPVKPPARSPLTAQ